MSLTIKEVSANQISIFEKGFFENLDNIKFLISCKDNMINSLLSENAVLKANLEEARKLNYPHNWECRCEDCHNEYSP